MLLFFSVIEILLFLFPLKAKKKNKNRHTQSIILRLDLFELELVCQHWGTKQADKKQEIFYRVIILKLLLSISVLIISMNGADVEESSLLNDYTIILPLGTLRLQRVCGRKIALLSGFKQGRGKVKIGKD